MKLKMVVFGSADAPSYDRIEAIVTSAFSSLANDTLEYPDVYSRVSDGLPTIDEALKKNDLIVIFADDEVYTEAKNTICRAFKFEMINSEPVLQKLRKRQDADRFLSHALMPRFSTPFPLSDGLFPGFAVRSKEQCIMFLPLNEDRIFLTMSKYAFPYLSRIYGVDLGSFTEHVLSYSASVLQTKLHIAKPQIAISNTNICKYIASVVKHIDPKQEYINYVPFDRKREYKDPTKTHAVLAREYYDSDYGVTVTEKRGEQNGSFQAVITVATRKKAIVRTLLSLPDETHEDFIYTVVSKLLLMLSDIITDPQYAPQTNRKKAKNKKHSGATAILLYIILFLVVFAATYFISVSYRDPQFLGNLFSKLNMSKLICQSFYLNAF